MRFILLFPSILMFCFAKSIMAVPMQVDELFESVRQEHSIDSYKPYILRESRVSGELLQTDTPYVKNQELPNIKQREIPSEEVTLQAAPLQEIPLREVIKYYKTLVEPDKEVFSNKVSTANRFSKTLPAGEPINPLSSFIDEFDELLKSYAISVETFNSIRNIFGDNTIVDLTESGEIVNLESQINTMFYDNYTESNYNLGFVQQNSFIRQRQDWSEERVLGFQKLINKLINIISHPISILIYLVLLFFILPALLVVRRAQK